MQKSGLAEIARAKADGRWGAAYKAGPAFLMICNEPSTGTTGPRPSFRGLDGRNRCAVLYRIHNAKTAKSRASHIAKFVAMLERGETIHPGK